MARRVFFSFEYEHDVQRAMIVRNCWVTQGEDAGFVDAADFEEIKKGGDAAIKKWIREQLSGTSVTVVLVGSHTCSSKYVEYEIEQSEKKGNGLLGIDISKIKIGLAIRPRCVIGYRTGIRFIPGTVTTGIITWVIG